MSKKDTILTTPSETEISDYAALDNDYPVWRESATYISDNVKSVRNRIRALKDLWDFAHWSHYRKPTIASVLEHMYHLIKDEGRTQGHTGRLMRYLYETSPILDGIPRIACIYVRCPYLLDTKEIVHWLMAVEDDDLRTAIALMASGYVKLGWIPKMTVGEYFPETFSIGSKDTKMPDWVRLYMIEHIKRCKEQNRSGDDPMFYNFEAGRPYSTWDLTAAMKHYDRRTGMTMHRHCYLVTHFTSVPKDGIVRYI